MICKRHFMGRKLCELTGILSRDIAAVGIGIAIAAGIALVVPDIALMCAGGLGCRNLRQILSKHMACTCGLHSERYDIALLDIHCDRSAKEGPLPVNNTADADRFLSICDGQLTAGAKLCAVKQSKELVNALGVQKLFIIDLAIVVPNVLQRGLSLCVDCRD